MKTKKEERKSKNDKSSAISFFIIISLTGVFLLGTPLVITRVWEDWNKILFYTFLFIWGVFFIAALEWLLSSGKANREIG